MDDTFSVNPDLSQDLKQQLRQAGIASLSELSEIGSEQAFVLLFNKNKKTTLQTLCELEAAIRGIPKNKLSRRRKKELEYFFSMANSYEISGT
jgi:hypothetical protein